MAYSLELITTVADCDSLIKMVEKQKEDLEFSQTSMKRQKENYAENTVELKSELSAIETELSAVNTIIAALPAGATKEENITKRQKLELKKRLLTIREADYGAIAVLDKEFDLARIGKELEETNAFITALQGRKAAL